MADMFAGTLQPTIDRAFEQLAGDWPLNSSAVSEDLQRLQDRLVEERHRQPRHYVVGIL
jgi:hypothetical protein